MAKKRIKKVGEIKKMTIKNKGFAKWYTKPENKKHMSEYMKKYNKKNKVRLGNYQKERKYDTPAKNRIRETLINFMNQYKIKKILTLESEDFIFSNLIPEKKVIVFEKDKRTFNLMEKSKPKNVSLFYGDIQNFAALDSKTDMIYLDFCGTYEFSKEVIYSLREQIKQCKLFAVTFSLRNGSEVKKKGFKQIGDYQFDLIRRLQELLETNFKVLYGEGYNESGCMVTMLFENIKEKEV